MYELPGADTLELLYERLELGTSMNPRGRGVALLSIRVHEPGNTEPASPKLAEVAAPSVLRSLRSCLRRIDTIAMVAPLHFLVLLERAEDGPFAVHVADKIVQTLRQPISLGGESRRLAASIGISVHPSDGENIDDLIRCADAAMSGAHLSGGDVFGFYSSPLNEAAGRRIAIERALVSAVERNEFALAFQPQIDTRDGSVAGVEALLRWTNDSLGAVSPAEFIPVLELTGRIDDIGEWVLREACRHAASWAREGHRIRVGVNVSAYQLRTHAFESAVVHALDRADLEPSLLELELTEGVLVENPGSTRTVLESLRRRGIRIAVDDFGTGYASLSYIRQFPMDTLKIERQFVRGLPVDQASAAITSAIVALGQSLRLELVAEGVETEAEEEFLHSLHCYVVQGFRHARPMFPDALAEWRQKRPWA